MHYVMIVVCLLVRLLTIVQFVQRQKKVFLVSVYILHLTYI